MQLPSGRRKAANVTLLTSLVEGKQCSKVVITINSLKGRHYQHFIKGCHYQQLIKGSSLLASYQKVVIIINSSKVVITINLQSGGLKLGFKIFIDLAKFFRTADFIFFIFCIQFLSSFLYWYSQPLIFVLLMIILFLAYLSFSSSCLPFSSWPTYSIFFFLLPSFFFLLPSFFFLPYLSFSSSCLPFSSSCLPFSVNPRRKNRSRILPSPKNLTN